MKHSQTTFRLVAIAAAAVLGILVLLWPMRAFAQPPVPHPIEGREDCLVCHGSGASGIPQAPESHADYGNDDCQTCHAEAGAETAGEAPPIPHGLEGFEDCTACHAPSTEMGAVAQPAATPAVVPTPIAYPEPEGGADTCLDCHAGLGGRSEEMIDAWQSSVHAESDVICSDCHGGDPNAEDMAAAMSPDVGYIGVPDRTDIPELCGSCHADVDQMRQYNLPTDQLDKYWESEHGQALAGGDTQVATCFDCHDHHATRAVDDPSSDVYFHNVPALCATCHEDAEYMASYDIPTDQFATYQGSVHGMALLENQDVRAPSCASCHSRHGASPPGVDEVANVCGSCHTATQDYYEDGRHAGSGGATPRCVTCHGYHNILVTGDEMFLGDQPGSCQSCHAPGSEEADAATALYDGLIEANENYEEAEMVVQRAMGLGMIMAEEESLLANSRTSLITARASQHTVNLETVEEDLDAAAEFSEQALQQAEEAIAQGNIRRMAMVIALVVIAIIVFSLLLLRRELHRSQS